MSTSCQRHCWTDGLRWRPENSKIDFKRSLGWNSTRMLLHQPLSLIRSTLNESLVRVSLMQTLQSFVGTPNFGGTNGVRDHCETKLFEPSALFFICFKTQMKFESLWKLNFWEERKCFNLRMIELSGSGTTIWLADAMHFTWFLKHSESEFLTHFQMHSAAWSPPRIIWNYLIQIIQIISRLSNFFSNFELFFLLFSVIFKFFRQKKDCSLLSVRMLIRDLLSFVRNARTVCREAPARAFAGTRISSNW